MRLLECSYSRSQRMLEIASMTACFAMQMILFAAFVDDATWSTLSFAVPAAIIGWALADFVSGFVHWAADTWGTPEWFFIGPRLIVPFREHHRDQLAMTKHDFIETNGNSCFVVLPALIVGMFLPHDNLAWWVGAAQAFILSFSFWILMVNQCHKLAHLPVKPWWLRMLRRLGVVLSPEEHARHHKHPFMGRYCIVSGVMNPLLDRIKFFRISEVIVSKLTGLVPREDDLAQVAAHQARSEALRSAGK